MACTGPTFNLSDCFDFGGANAASTYPNLAALINNVIPNIFTIAGVVLVFMILLGGFTIISSASDTHKLEEGTKTITSAIMGLLILIGSFWIIQIIQVVTGVKILNSTL
jgi:hypothetical protein